MKVRSFLIVLIVSCVSLFLSNCSDSSVASANISRAAHQFEVFRRVVFYNGITDSYILSVEAYCSVTEEAGRLAVTIKTSNGTFLKHYLGLSDNVTYFAEQLEAKSVSTGKYRVIFKPGVIVPNIDVE